LGVPVAFLAAAAVHAQTPCEAFKDFHPDDRHADCVCSQSALKSLSVTPPANMRLVAACGAEKDTFGFLRGVFYFAGPATISGSAVRERSEASGDAMFFEASSPPGKHVVFKRAPGGMRLGDAPATFRGFSAPKPTEKTPCWVAGAKIRLASLRVVAGSGGEAGSYPIKYDVLSVGKYRACRE
jgi:hypothetical protein